MDYSKPMQMLVEEHRVILSVLDAVEEVAREDSSRADMPQEFYEKALDFFSTFADRCHHAKEEDLLFPTLEARGIPREYGPIGCMLHEHEQGRSHLAAARNALPAAAQGNALARATLNSEMLAYVELLRQHIQKENEVLFVMGDQRMTQQDKDRLWKQFQCSEHGDLPAGTHEKYVTLAAELSAKTRA
ncbi:MAG: hemerythrin domain-containing protein [Phycisphaerae bacterium]|jgi:hemerythrin-like domain-containing protein|nr:hemerythrin domain-containing protein [Phycisphaerae bacterium]